MNDHAGWIDGPDDLCCVACGEVETSRPCLGVGGLPSRGSFDVALRHLRLGHRVAREGWNGKGMWVKAAGERAIPRDEAAPGSAVHLEGSDRLRTDGDILKDIEGAPYVHTLPRFDLRTAHGDIQVGWLPSAADIFATDWVVVPEPLDS